MMKIFSLPQRERVRVRWEIHPHLASPVKGEGMRRIFSEQTITRMECHDGTRCPYLKGGDVWRLIRKRYYLSQRSDEMEKVMALAQA